MQAAAAPRRWARRTTRRALLLLALLGWLTAVPAMAVDESDLKAAITFNLLLFVDWPADSLPGDSARLSLCVCPDSAPYAALRALNDRPIGNRRLEVRDWTAEGAGAGAGPCHAAYVDAATRLSRLAALKRGASMFVVSDEIGIPADGTVIVLRRQASRIGFEVDLRAARSARLQLSSKLLRLALQVRE